MLGFLLAVDMNNTVSAALAQGFGGMFPGAPLMGAILLLLIIGIFLFKAQTPLAVVLPLGLIITYTFMQGFGDVFNWLYYLAVSAIGLVVILALFQLSNR